MLRCRLRKPENAKSVSLYLSLSAWHFEMDKKFAHRSIMQDRQTGEPIKTLASPSSWSEEILGWCNQMSVTPDKLIHREFTRKSLQLQIKTVYHASHFLLPRIQVMFDFLFDVLLTFFGIFYPKFCVSTLGRSLPKQGEVSWIYMKAAKQPPDASTRGERPNGKNGQFQAPSTSASSNLRD